MAPPFSAWVRKRVRRPGQVPTLIRRQADERAKNPGANVSKPPPPPKGRPRFPSRRQRSQTMPVKPSAARGQCRPWRQTEAPNKRDPPNPPVDKKSISQLARFQAPTNRGPRPPRRKAPRETSHRRPTWHSFPRTPLLWRPHRRPEVKPARRNCSTKPTPPAPDTSPPLTPPSHRPGGSLGVEDRHIARLRFGPR